MVWFLLNRVGFHAAWSEHCFKDQETGEDEKHNKKSSEKFIIKMPQKSQIQEDNLGTSLVVQWLSLYASTAGAQVRPRN